MKTTVNIREARTQLSKLIERVRPGEEIVIAEAGPARRPSGPEEARRAKARQLGTGKGEIIIHDSFHDDLPGWLLDLFEGKGDDPPGSGDQPLEEHEGR